KSGEGLDLLFRLAFVFFLRPALFSLSFLLSLLPGAFGFLLGPLLLALLGQNFALLCRFAIGSFFENSTDRRLQSGRRDTERFRLPWNAVGAFHLGLVGKTLGLLLEAAQLFVLGPWVRKVDDLFDHVLLRAQLVILALGVSARRFDFPVLVL